MKDIHLFIGNQEVEFGTTPDILYNYDLETATNPTIVKNSYTKSIIIEGTDANNKLFNNIWNLGMYQPSNGSNGYFNPSKRVEFSLYINGDLYETGYCKLDTISHNGQAITYSITLYGGIGDFFYSLSYNDDGEELKLRDLAYTDNADPSSELDFNITKETVNNAWNRLEYGTGDTKWDIINFMPAYEGYPSNLDTDKVLINTNGYSGETRIHSSITTTVTGFPQTITGGYSLSEGYALAEINGNMTEWDMRDLRSYCQRPVIRMKAIIDACCNPSQNGGYDVQLDSSFFNTGNTYYEKAWVTLPLLSDMERVTTTQDWNLHINRISTYNGAYNTTYDFAEDSARGASTASLSITFRPKLKVKNLTSPYPDTLYTSAFISGANSRTDQCSYVYQFVAYDNSNNVIGGSGIYNLTSMVNGKFLNLNNTVYKAPYQTASIYNRIGDWTKVGDTDTYEWGEDLTLTIDTTGIKVAKVALNCVTVANLVYDNGIPSYNARQFKLYASTGFTEAEYSAKTKNSEWVIPTVSGVAEYSTSTEINSGAKINKQMLLSVDGTPALYLINYCKCFNLHFEKDPIRKKIYIKTRSNFYNGTNVDLQDRIDRSSIEITPLTFEHKWYNFKHSTPDESSSYDAYYNKYGAEYGVQKVNTGYNFDSETKDLLEGTPYKGAVEALEKSAYFQYRKHNNTLIPNFLFSWCSYNLFNASGDSESVEIAGPLNTNDYNYGNYGDYYDFFPKVQLRDGDNKPLDGSGVFVYFNGFKDTKAYVQDGEVSVPFNLTDDLYKMVALNNKACWLWTQGATDISGNVISIIKTSLPSFNRFVMDGNFIKDSWDFGKTKELYVPLAKYVEGSTIYDKYWYKYINDLYDVNNRKLECNVVLPNVQGQKLLKNFYWFDNSIWVINKISDWNICSIEPTKVEFIKVQNQTNYTTNITPIIPTAETFVVSSVVTPEVIPASGGTFTLLIDSNKRWYCDSNSIWDGSFVAGTINGLEGGHYAGITTLTGTMNAYSNPFESRIMRITVIDDFDNEQYIYISQRNSS